MVGTPGFALTSREPAASRQESRAAKIVSSDEVAEYCGLLREKTEGEHACAKLDAVRASKSLID